jgi:isopenicillin-N N-acyltransferase-like protein
MSPEYAGPEKIELSGSPREVSSPSSISLYQTQANPLHHKIGLKHGKQLADKIRNQIQVYDSMFQHTSKLDWPAVRDIAGAYASTIEKLTPDLYAEMQGIADGAGLDILDVVALNCRSEIALGLFSDGCTSLGWRTRADGVVLAQNWDWTGSVKRNLVMMSIEREGLPKVFMVTEVCLVEFRCIDIVYMHFHIDGKLGLDLHTIYIIPYCTDPHRLAS